MKTLKKDDVYRDYISPEIQQSFEDRLEVVQGVPGLYSYGPLRNGETPESLAFASRLYRQLRPRLKALLNQRQKDREFIDTRMQACSDFNSRNNIPFSSPDYLTPLGMVDGDDRVVFGPLKSDFTEPIGAKAAEYHDGLGGPQITLFGPPDSPTMAINAMNCYHRKLSGEPEVIEELLGKRDYRPRWGADVEDSKTPIRDDMASAAVNLSACLRGDLTFEDKKRGKTYTIEADKAALPIKRFPGLALPCGFLYQDGENFPLHLYDFALHVFNNWSLDDALIFYVPKLENEEEAAYIHQMVSLTEDLISAEHSEYKKGSIRLMIVLENPRAIVRANEIMDALHPYFLGASLGWHDYLASTARLFKNESRYRIPVKADPEIVIKHIKASHDLVARVVGGRKGLALGGMYGVLPLESQIGSQSFTVTLAGFFRDVITQLKRGLNGFWVAHPDFVRIGIALVIAWEEKTAGDDSLFIRLTRDLLGSMADEVLAFADGHDIQGLDAGDPKYIRELIVASLEESDFIANNHPDEIRYNVFQALQYLADWLSGNGCVALPAHLGSHPVRIMDDLATTERSRWEVWHELRHGRFDLSEFMKIALEELDFIKRDLSDDSKIVRIKWDMRTGPWYPVAFHLMLQLMTAENPPEFATELLMPFTLDGFRNGESSLIELARLHPQKYMLPVKVDRYLTYYQLCGCHDLSGSMSTRLLFDPAALEASIMNFNEAQLLEAAAQHGDIGASRAALDSLAAAEQAGLAGETRQVLEKLSSLGQSYLDKFGFKFLVSAAGKDAATLLSIVEKRIHNSRDEEFQNALSALAEIAIKRARSAPPERLPYRPYNIVLTRAEEICKRYDLPSMSFAVSDGPETASDRGGLSLHQAFAHGSDTETLYDIASLSKSVGTAFALELLKARGYSIHSKVKDILQELGSQVSIQTVAGGEESWIKELEIQHLMSHSAMNMHYVPGITHEDRPSSITELLMNPEKYGYEAIAILNKPGSTFSYSGAGFLLLEHICELMLGDELSGRQEKFVASFLDSSVAVPAANPDAPASAPDAGVRSKFSFNRDIHTGRALGHRDDGTVVSDPPLWFPGFAAGCLANPSAMLSFLCCLSRAYSNPEGCGAISHDTAVLMLKSRDRFRSPQVMDFMGLDMSLGIFSSPMGPNNIAVHQGANDGYRSIFFFVTDGPDAGKGFAVFANGDNRAVGAVAEISRLLIRSLQLQGFDASLCAGSFEDKGISQEQIVNRGYKELLFAGIQEMIADTVPADHADEDELLAQSLIAAQSALACSDQRFAPVSNLVRTTAPLFDPMLFCSQGKVMDSWETARHNPTGCDWAIFPLKERSPIRHMFASTAYHDGNHVEAFSLWAFDAGEQGGPAAAVPAFDSDKWREIVPVTKTAGHSELYLALAEETGLFTHVKVNVYPDGGFSRLALFAELPTSAKWAQNFSPDAQWKRLDTPIPAAAGHSIIPITALPKPQAKESAAGESVNLASALAGAKVLSVSNEHYGPASALLSPMDPIHMFDGLESRRSREPGHFEEAVIALAAPGRLQRIELDFSFFVNNNPVAMDILAAESVDGPWTDLVIKTPTKAWAGNIKVIEVSDDTVYTTLKIRLYPDGGCNRIRVYGVAAN